MAWLALLSSNDMLTTLGCTQGGKNQCPGYVNIIWEEKGKSETERDQQCEELSFIVQEWQQCASSTNLGAKSFQGSPQLCKDCRGGLQTQLSGLSLREDEEAREDAVGPFQPYQGVLLRWLQPDGLVHGHLEDHAICGDLETAVHEVTEGHHPVAPAATPALFDVEAQVAPGGDVVGKVVDAGHAAGEAAVAVLVVPVLVGDDAVKADGQLPAGVGADAPGSGERGLEGDLVVTRLPHGARQSTGTS